MNIDDLRAMIDRDSKLDLVQLSQQSINIPQLSSKYQNILSELLRKQKVIDSKRNKTRRELLEYYRGYAHDDIYKERPLRRKVAAGEIDTYIKADDRWIEIDSKYQSLSDKIDLVEAFIKNLNQMSFNIKNAIEWQKFNNGGY